ncbi:MAG: hypothetical protein QNL87_09885 [Gammaproteobacteria bacterium]|nr:hypothetical protein [Gammaproteobacteria bacterium]
MFKPHFSRRGKMHSWWAKERTASIFRHLAGVTVRVILYTYRLGSAFDWL